MTAMPLLDFTDAEKARLDAIEAAPAAEESVRERVAAALWDAADGAGRVDWNETNDWWRNVYRRLADAAIDVLRGPSSDAEQAVERVLALADEWEHTALTRGVARVIRAAVAGD